MRSRRQILDYQRDYRATHSQRISEQKAAWYKAHLEEQRKKRRDRYQLNKQEYIDRAAAWAKANPDKMRISRHQWANNNTHRMRMHGTNYRAKKAGLISEKYNRLIIYERDGGICRLCKKTIFKYYKFPHPQSLTIDHILPISLGGHDITGNIQIAHLACNSRKRDRI